MRLGYFGSYPEIEGELALCQGWPAFCKSAENYLDEVRVGKRNGSNEVVEVADY